MHLLIPYAAVSAPDCRSQWPLLSLPSLSALLARLTPAATDAGDDHSLSPPHERALALALQLPATGDGRLAWAAYFSLAGSANSTWLGQATGENTRAAPTACAWFTPCHWQVGMDQVVLLAPEDLALSEADSRALLAALAPLAAEDGITLVYEAPLRWRAEGALFADLACASLDRVVGRSLTDWLPDTSAAPAATRLLRRLQSEAQMLFYTHRVSDERSARGLLAVNSFWVSGAGQLPQPWAAPPPTPHLTVPTDLRAPALQGHWPVWAQQWQSLDAGPVRAALQHLEAGGDLTLTLCGERHSRQWHSTPPRGWLQRLQHGWRSPTPAWKTLETL